MDEPQQLKWNEKKKELYEEKMEIGEANRLDGDHSPEANWENMLECIRETGKGIRMIRKNRKQERRKAEFEGEARNT